MWRKQARRVGQAAGVVLVALVGTVLVRTATVTSRQPAAVPLDDAPIDGLMVAGHLASAIRFETVSESATAKAPAAALSLLRGHLEQAFPKVTTTLSREIVAEHSLLYTWKGDGTDEADAPIILCAHQDVVPVEAGTAEKWVAPPFSGKVDGPFVWGRGALDDKASLVSILEAVEALIGEGFRPRRTVYLAFGHDEEVSGKGGARAIVELLASRGVHAEVAIDEGLAIVTGIVASIAGPVAPIGIGEKGYLTATLSVDLPGGHSSMPASESAINVLNAALARLVAHPMPARLDGATKQFFEWTAPEMGFGQRLVLANTWLTWPLVARTFARSPALNALIRTTTAVTVVRSGVKDNVVPRSAEAQVNFRVLPGDTTAGVLAHISEAIADARVVVAPQASSLLEPSRLSRADSRAFDAIARVTREVFPTATVAPALVLGGTDGRKYEAVARDVYRFLPQSMGPGDLARVHGTDERIAISSLVESVRFYRRLLRVLAGP